MPPQPRSLEQEIDLYIEPSHASQYRVGEGACQRSEEGQDCTPTHLFGVAGFMFFEPYLPDASKRRKRRKRLRDMRPAKQVGVPFRRMGLPGLGLSWQHNVGCQWAWDRRASGRRTLP